MEWVRDSQNSSIFFSSAAGGSMMSADYYYKPFSSNRRPPMKPGRERKSMSLLLGSDSDTREDKMGGEDTMLVFELGRTNFDVLSTKVGGILSGECGDENKYMSLLDVAPLNLGIETVGGVMTKLIPGNTVVPTKKSIVLTAYQNKQPTDLSIQVFKGDQSLTNVSRLLGNFDLTGIPPSPRAPELYEDEFGMCMLEMVTCESPYNECRTLTHMYETATLDIKPLSYNIGLDPEVRQLTDKCLLPALSRPTSLQPSKHTFLARDETKDDSGLVASSSSATKPVRPPQLDYYYKPVSSNRRPPMEPGREKKSMSLLLGSRRTDSDMNSEIQSSASDTESSGEDDSDSDDESEVGGKKTLMKGLRRSEVLKRLPANLRNRYKHRLLEVISYENARTLLGERRYSYVMATNPTGVLHISDSTVLTLFYKPKDLEEKSTWSEDTIEDTIVRSKYALGFIRDQLQHDNCWTFASSDMVSASLVLHGWEEKYEPLCTGYLLQKVNPRKYKDSKRVHEDVKHQCYGEELEKALVYIKKFGIPKERLNTDDSCTTEWLPIPGEDMFKITDIYRYQTLKQALKRLRTHPVGATLVGFQGLFDTNQIYRGPFGENAVFRDYHAVIISHCRIINGEMVAFCKSSSGEVVGLEGDKGYIAVSLEVMLIILGIKRKDENKNTRCCSPRPHYLLKDFYSINMDYKNPKPGQQEEEAEANKEFKINERKYKRMKSPFETADSVKKMRVKKPLSRSSRFAGIKFPVRLIHRIVMKRVSAHRRVGATAARKKKYISSSARVGIPFTFGKGEQGSEKEWEFAACNDEMRSLTLSSKERLQEEA